MELFTESDLINPAIIKAINDLQKAGWKDRDQLENLLIVNLNNSGKKEYIPTLKKQFQLIRRSNV